MKNLKIFMILVVALIALNSAVCVAYAETINLGLNSSKIIILDRIITKIFVSNHKIVGVKQPSEAMNEFVITSFGDAGNATLFIWTADGARYEYTVNVSENKTTESDTIEEMIREVTGISTVHVKKVGDKVLITGTVDTPDDHEKVYGVVSLFVKTDKETERTSVLDPDSGTYLSKTNSKDNSGNIIDQIKILNPYQVRNPLEIEIENTIGLPNVHVKVQGKENDERILLTGTVKNQYERNLAVQTARLFVGSGSGSSLNFGSNTNPTLSTQSSNENSSNTTLTNTDKVEARGSVIDLLQMTEPAQIRLEAQIISINPQDTNNLGILWDGTGSGTVANPGIFYAGENQSSGDFRNNPFKWLMNSRTNLNFRLSALITQNKAKILSRPSIMTLSGEQATIQIGGEIPYTVINSTTGISSTNFKSYGIILQFKPIIDAENHLVTTVHTEVSNMSGETVNGLPIINTRRADAVVNLESGSTMIIGGLMDSSESKVVTKIPLLSKIPILGEFFKYTSKSKDKQELVILVTPYIVGENETSYAGMSNDLRDYYHAGQREHNALNDVDLNALPPPFEDEKTKKDKKKKKAEKSKKDKKDRNSEEEPTPNEAETAEDDNNDDSEKHSNTSVGVEVFGDIF